MVFTIESENCRALLSYSSIMSVVHLCTAMWYVTSHDYAETHGYMLL